VEERATSDRRLLQSQSASLRVVVKLDDVKLFQKKKKIRRINSHTSLLMRAIRRVELAKDRRMNASFLSVAFGFRDHIAVTLNFGTICSGDTFVGGADELPLELLLGLGHRRHLDAVGHLQNASRGARPADGYDRPRVRVEHVYNFEVIQGQPVGDRAQRRDITTDTKELAIAKSTNETVDGRRDRPDECNGATSSRQWGPGEREAVLALWHNVHTRNIAGIGAHDQGRVDT